MNNDDYEEELAKEAIGIAHKKRLEKTEKNSTGELNEK